MTPPARTAIEAKVAVPALVVGIAIVLVPELYGVAKSYGFDPNPDQDLSIIKLGAALAYVAHVYFGYRAPHTPRPDVPHPEAESPPPPDDEPAQAAAVGEVPFVTSKRTARKRINVVPRQPLEDEPQDT